MEIPGEVADSHKRTDAMNLVTTARTIACPESIHDLADSPTQKCLADCLTKASAKADNLIQTVKTVRLLEVDVHPNFRTLMEHKAFLST